MKPASESNRKDDHRAGYVFAMGVGLGTALGIVFHNLALGVGLGTAFGLAFAGAIRSRSSKQD